MTFRIDDLTVAVLPERFGVEAADCTKCTKCTKCTQRTGGPSGCEDTVTDTGNCCDPNGFSDGVSKSEADVDHLSVLMAQLEEVLVSAG